MKIAVVGASGELGRRVLGCLAHAGVTDLVATTRAPDHFYLPAPDEGQRPAVRQLDLTDVSKAVQTLKDCDRVIFTPILTLSEPVATALREAGSKAGVIMVSSNNAGIDYLSPVYEDIRASEERVSKLSGDWAIVRPTMLYGAPDDGNIGRLTQIAMTRPVLPMPGSGKALHQPIHYSDMAELLAMLVVRQSLPQIKVSAFGSEVLTLNEMYRHILEQTGSKALVLRPPLWALKSLTTLFGKIGPISKDQLKRAELDRVPTWPAMADWDAKTSFAQGVAGIADAIRTGAGK